MRTRIKIILIIMKVEVLYIQGNTLTLPQHTQTHRVFDWQVVEL